MAASFRFNTAPSTTAAKSTGFEKAEGFLNFSLPDGQVGKIALLASNPTHSAIIKVCKTPDGLAKVTGKIKVTYNPVATERSFSIPGLKVSGAAKVEIADDRASAYFNVDVIDDDGAEIRLGGMPLYKKEPMHAWLMSVMAEAKENVDAVIAALKFNYRSGTKQGANLSSLFA